MYTPRGDTVQSRSLSTPPPAALTAGPLTAQQAEESIDYVQRELARLLRACEYREQHPYDAAAITKDAEDSAGTALASAVPLDADGNDSTGAAPEAWAVPAPGPAMSQRHDSALSLPASAQPPLQLAPSMLASATPCTQRSPRTPGRGAAAAAAATTASAKSTTIAGTGTTAAPSTTGPSTSLGGASFSSFERRRIAHLLGRVALEIAGVWAFVQHVDPSSGGAATPTSSLPTTARGTLRQSSDHSTAAPVASTASPTPSSAPDEAVTVDARAGAPHDTPSLRPPVLRRGVWGATARERCDAYEGDPAAQIAALGALIETAEAIRLALVTPPPDGARTKTATPAGAAAAAAAVPAVLVVPPRPAPTVRAGVAVSSDTPGTPDGGAECESPVVESSSLSNTLSNTMEAAPAGSLTFSSPSFGASRTSLREAIGNQLRGAVPAAAAALRAPPSTAPRTADDASEGISGAVPRGGAGGPHGASSAAAPGRATRSPSPLLQPARVAAAPTTCAAAIPSYLRAYVVDDAAAHPPAPAPTGAGAPNPPQSRTPETVKPTFVEPPASRRTHAATLHFTSTPPTAAAAASAPIAIATTPSGQLVDVVPTSYGSFLPMQRATSASSLRSTSLMGSPVQAAQLSGMRSLQGFSGGSASSQHNNTSASQRSPDSAEMSPAAVAAYSRSTSLLRRPHRLEVPVSRTHSLRRLPSLSSPVSVAGASLASAPSSAATAAAAAAAGAGAGTAAAAHPPSTTASVLAAALHGAQGGTPAPSYAASKSASSFRAGSGGGGGGGGGGGILRTSSYSASSPPVALGGSVTVDSPHSSVAGMHFKRVISLDSEGGVWPQSSLADSLEMSQLKPGSLLGRPSASAMRATLSSSPPPPPHHAEPRTSGPHARSSSSGGGGGVVPSADAYGPVTSPVELPSGYSMLNGPASGSFSFGQLRGVPTSGPTTGGSGGGGGPARHDRSRSHSSQSRTSTPNPLLTGSPIVAVSSPGVYGPAALRSRSATAPAMSASPPRDGLRGSVVVPPSAKPASYVNPSAALGKSMSSGGLGLSAEEDLPPHSYRVEHEVLTEFLRCVHDLRHTSLTEAEFDSLQLRYFLPGVSLHTSPRGHGWPPQPPSPSAPPLPLFEGGDAVPLRRDDIDTFCALVRERLVLVCHNLRIAASPYLALL